MEMFSSSISKTEGGLLRDENFAESNCGVWFAQYALAFGNINWKTLN